MKNCVYLIDLENNDNSALELAINEVIERIPCFVTENLVCYNEVDCLELTITCMDFEVPFVERMLAPFV